MRILLITPGVLGQNFSGGNIRTNAIRDALMSVGQVDTIRVTSTDRFELESRWSSERVRDMQVNRKARIRDRVAGTIALRRGIRAAMVDGEYNLVVVRQLSHLRYIGRRHRSLTILDTDDFIKTSTDRSLPAITKIRLRNAIAPRYVSGLLHVWVATERDRAHLRRTTSSSVLKNVVPLPRRPPSREAKVSYRLTMVGLFLFPPNAAAARWFVERVLPDVRDRYPDTELHLIGAGASGLLSGDHRGVKVRGFVDDLDAEYDLTSLAIAPVASGSGTQIKVIDALVHGCPLVSSPFAHRGFSDVLVEGDHLLVAETAGDWVRQISDVFDDATEAEHMAQRGRLAAEVNYSTDRVREHVGETITNLGLAGR